jgi:hypothetical protein
MTRPFTMRGTRPSLGLMEPAGINHPSRPVNLLIVSGDIGRLCQGEWEGPELW